MREHTAKGKSLRRFAQRIDKRVVPGTAVAHIFEHSVELRVSSLETAFGVFSGFYISAISGLPPLICNQRCCSWSIARSTGTVSKWRRVKLIRYYAWTVEVHTNLANII